MRNTRKWLVLLLTIVMLVSNLGVTAMAVENESPIALSVSPAAEPGSALQVQILATQAQTVADGKLVVTYDAAKLTYNGAETGAAWAEEAQLTLSVNPTDGKVILAFANADAASEGVLFTLSFTANETGETVIALDGSSYITGVEANLAQEVSTCPSAQFVDVTNLLPEIHTAVDFMVANGYMNGMSETMFGPNVDLNRAMMVTILYRIDGCPEPEGHNEFTDVPNDVFYTNAVIWADVTGLTTGVSENLFAPAKPLTRQELVTFLYRFAYINCKDVTAADDLSAYTDANKIQPYARDAFEWAVAEGIIKGTSATTLEPEATTTRAQVALMVCRMLSSWE